MALITINNLSKSFGNDTVFEDVSVSVPNNGRIGLIGENGTGKTTLLKLILGEELPDGGTIQISKNSKIGYLPQTLQFNTEKTPYDFCLDSFETVIQIEKRIAELNEEVSRDHGNTELIEELGKLQDTFENMDGYQYRNQIRYILQGLNISDEQAKKPWNQLSGGQKVRAYLAKILCEKPDILMLDEPTNHLDIYAVEWLESYLKDYKGAILAVSHDRYFLDRCVTKIWDLNLSIEEYHGNYSSYVQQKKERDERKKTELEEIEKHIQKEEEYIRRNIAGQNTRQAQGRRKRLETFIKENENITRSASEKINIKMKTDLRSGDITLRTKDLKIGYHDDHKVLVEVPDITLIRGETAALIGPNGTGKSTLVKTLLGNLEPLEGVTELGSNVRIGYFAQAHEGLDPEKDLMDEIQSVAPKMLPADIRNYLAQYLFRGDDVYNKVGILSGGEKGRLALAKLSLQGANLLLLDEPMNHLDIQSQEILQEVIDQFEGTIILVSHDRYLIDAVATQIWEVDPERKSLIVYNGSYSEYKEYQTRVPQKTVENTEKVSASNYFEDKKTKREQKKKKNEIEKIEQQIASLEKEIAEISTALETFQGSYDKMMEKAKDYEQKQSLLNEWMEKWILLQDE